MICTAALLLYASAAGAVAETTDEREPERYAQLMIRERVIVRVPTRGRAPAPKIIWKEKKGPDCIPMTGIAGAAVTRPDSVDFILRGGKRIRARLESACPALDYYSGFYLSPTEDGRICQDRDSIHARSGGECQITRFRLLVPVEKP